MFAVQCLLLLLLLFDEADPRRQRSWFKKKTAVERYARACNCWTGRSRETCRQRRCVRDQSTVGHHREATYVLVKEKARVRRVVVVLPRAFNKIFLFYVLRYLFFLSIKKIKLTHYCFRPSRVYKDDWKNPLNRHDLRPA